MTVMKTPDDLDVFGPDQIDITRHLEAGGKDKRDRLVLFAAKTQNDIDAFRTLRGLSLPDWQRAAYEAHQMAKSDPDNSSLKLIATAAWNMVRYLQEATAYSEMFVKDPAFIEQTTRAGIKLPEIAED